MQLSEVLRKFGLKKRKNINESNNLSKVKNLPDIIKDDNLWKFARIERIEESMFNKVLEKFHEMGIYGLTRENIQNSLDGKLTGSKNPVIVTIKTGQIEQEYIPGLDEIKGRIKCLKGGNKYTKDTIEHMVKNMSKNPVNFISFEDSNTRGLRGAMNGQSDSEDDTWSVYAYSKGVHSNDSNYEFEQSRGGSHGIGKIASNAASDIYMMYFANCDEEGNKHLGGTVQLIEHKYKDEYFRSTGYFTDEKQVNEGYMKYYPYKNHFNEIFSKNTRGLKIIIPFLREKFNNEKEIIKSICDSFFIAIIKGELEVIVNNHHINTKTIQDYILSEEYYVQEISEIKSEFTPLYYDTYMNKKPISIKIKSINREFGFKLYFSFNDKIPKGRVAIIRSIGMKIEDKKITGNANKPFNAVLIPETVKEDAFLKSLENESHTELSNKHIKDHDLQKDALRFINNISREISKIIDEEIKKNNPTDGLMNTEDILYLVENQFRQDLSKAVTTVKINKGNKNLTLVKVTPKINKKREFKDIKDKDKNKDKKKMKKVKRDKKDDDSKEKEQTRYSVPSNIVERLVLGNKEILKFNFKDNYEMKNFKNCNISISVVDGMGNEYANEFNMKENYTNVFENSTGIQCEIQNNLIKDIPIRNDIAQVVLELNEKFNKALKFVYYVEV